MNITQNELPVKAQADASKAEVSPFDDQVVKTVSTDMRQIIKCSAGTSLISSKNFPSLPSPPVPFNGFEGLTLAIPVAVFSVLLQHHEGWNLPKAEDSKAVLDLGTRRTSTAAG